MAIPHNRETWYSRTAREWPLVVFTAVVTAVVTALFTSGGQYIAIVKVENEKVRSGNVIKTSDDFQNRFSTILTNLQKFDAAAVREKTVPQLEKTELSSSILTMRLSMAPATGRWPDNIVVHTRTSFLRIWRISKGSCELHRLFRI